MEVVVGGNIVDGTCAVLGLCDLGIAARF